MSPKKLIYQDDVAKFEVRDDLASNDPLVVLPLPMRVGSRVRGVLLVNDDIFGVTRRLIDRVEEIARLTPRLFS